MMGYPQMPVLVLKEGTSRESGKDAQSKNIAAARAIADTIKTTLGPKGMDKMLVDGMGDVTITNDGATILKELDIEHPTAKIMVEVAKTQEQECGDGTTTSVVLTGELLKKAEELLNQNIHPTVIVSGYRMASEKAIEHLEKLGKKINIDDEETLKKIAKTSMMSKSAGMDSDILADVAVKAVKSVAEEINGKYKVNTDNIQVIKKNGGAVADTEMIKGIIIDKEVVHGNMPKTVQSPRIALIDSALEIKKTEIDAKININTPDQIQNFLAQEENTLKEMVDSIAGSGANVVFCQKGIDDMVQHFLAKKGIYAVRRVKKSDMYKLAKATGANIVSKVSEIREEDLGEGDVVEQKKVGDDNMTFVLGCKNPKAVSILVRGGTEHVTDEIDRSLNDAISVVADAVEDSVITPGGGAIPMELSLRLKDYSNKVSGREHMAIAAFADALESIPRTIAENSGLDPIETLLKLRSIHSDNNPSHGVNVETGEPTDMYDLGIIEPLRVQKQAITSATDASTMILRIDDIIASESSNNSNA